MIRIRLTILILACCAVVAIFAGAAYCAITVPSDGSDGAFSPSSSVTIDLSQADTAAWNAPAPHPGKGVYDASKWAVVFKYSEVNIPQGVTVTFKNHPSGAPVVWLVQGSVSISGGVSLNGADGNSTHAPVPSGPGGFRGGAAQMGSSPGMMGLGPGGGSEFGHGGSYASPGSGGSGPIYGSPAIIPLTGGSGGASGGADRDGGGGGGAILVACGTTLTVNGAVSACGGTDVGTYWGGGGSGGAIRLIADTLAGQTSGRLTGAGGGGILPGGSGRIRIEANTNTFEGLAAPDASTTTPTDPPAIWPGEGAPSIKVTHVGGVAVPSDPRASFSFPNQDVSLTTGTPQQFAVRLAATNVPVDWVVSVRLTARYGDDPTVAATLVSGDGQSSVWEAQVTVPTGFSAIQARASRP
jgi:hypothetical protein